MTIQTRIHDGIKVKTRTWRDIPYDRRGLASFREGFMSQAEYSKWGEMTILKGTKRILVAKFGRVE